MENAGLAAVAKLRIFRAKYDICYDLGKPNRNIKK
jgi:hypothetical protein